MANAEPRTTSWIDLKIPLWGVITLFLALVGQSATLLMWGARIDARVTENTDAIAKVEARMAGTAHLSETVARVDERTKALQETVNRIEQRVAGGR